jgi:hypothetical protein
MKQKAEYIISADGHIMQNEAGVALAKVISDAMSAKARLEATYVGALLANVFLENPWLASFTLSLSVSYEYDDEGGSYRCVSTNIEDVLAIQGVETEFLDDDGKFLPDGAEEFLKLELEDSGSEIRDGIEGDFSSTVLELVCERSAIAELLLEKPISGADTFSKMFPDRAAFLGIGGDRGQ